MGSEIIIATVIAILKYGPGAVASIAAVMDIKGDDITPEDIRELFIEREPEDYFNEF